MWRKVLVGLVAFLFLAALWVVSFAQEDEESAARQLEVERILAKLNGTKVSLEFIDTPLAQAMEFFGKALELNIVIDPRIYGEGRTEEDMIVNLKVDDLKAMTAVRIILGFWELRMVYRDGVLMVTTKESDELILRVYDARDLVVEIENFPGPSLRLDDEVAGLVIEDWFEEPPPPDQQLEEIVNIIRTTTGVDSWNEESGTSVSIIGTGLLVVVQSEEVHREIAELLAQLRAAR